MGLFVSSVAVLVAAEWPRLKEVLPLRLRRRRRRRRRSHLVLVENEGVRELDEESEAFAESVTRDLERLPTVDDRD